MLRWGLTIFAVACTIAPAAASTIEELSPVRLYAEAERVVDGTVIALRTQWDAQGSGLETFATIEIEATWRGPASATVELVIPGGTLEGARHIFLGAPATAIGERARWFLRDRGDGRLGVYGWAQGKWPVRIANGAASFAPGGVAAEHPTNLALFAGNGMVWPTSPVPYLVQQAGSDDLAMGDVTAAIDAAFATWQAVPCAALAFRNEGLTPHKVKTDGNNVILFIEANWIYGAEAAAATSLWIVDGEQTADIAMNGQHFTWATGPGNQLMATTLDLQGVLTHEIGHFSGLGHSDRAYDTMYFSWKPWQSQRTLSLDDKLGLCSIYAIAGDECPAIACPTGETCTPTQLGRLCAGVPDPIGAACHYDRVECDAFCLFTAIDLSMGYCSRLCVSDAECPLTHHCDVASAGTMAVKVCFAGAQPVPPPDPEPPPACTTDDACPLGLHCDVLHGACTFECRSDADCATGNCDDRGVCGLSAGGGGGCRSHDAPLGLGLVLLAGFAGVRRRRLSTKCAAGEP